VDTVVVKAKSQRLVRFRPTNHERLQNLDNVLLEGYKSNFSESLIAKSLHDLNSDMLYCNVINAGDEDLTIRKDEKLGHLSSVDLANEIFEEEVKQYKKLDVNRLKQKVLLKNQYTGYSKCQNSKPSVDVDMSFELNVANRSIIDQINKIKMGPKLTINEQQLMREVIISNKDAFQWSKTDLGFTKLVEHHVYTSGGPVQSSQYPIHQAAKQNLRDQTKEMLDKKVIRDSHSEWRSPVLLIKKKSPDNSVQYRFCIDLKKVNAVTTKDCYSLPIIGDTVDSLDGCKYFTSMDVDQAFWQVPMAEEDKKKYAFVVEGRLYEFNRMPFGAMNAPATFQRLIDRVLRGLTWKQCLVYMDDVLIFSKTFEQHLIDVDEVLNRFKLAGLKLKPTKCSFAEAEVEYLGFKLSEKGMHATTKKIDTVLNLKPPQTNKQLYSFLCSMSYYRMLIPKYGHRTALLYDMINSGDKACKWNDESIKEFNDLRMALISAPILAYPDWSKPFILNTDASGRAMAGVLLQLHDGVYKPVAFCGRKYSTVESRYSASERELLAIQYSYEQFEHYLYGRDFDCYTDHEPLVTAAKFKKPFGRLSRIFSKLPSGKYNIKYIPGKSNFLPDFLSRIYDGNTKEIETNLINLESTIDWRLEQNKDECLHKVVELLTNDSSDKEWEVLPNWRRWLHERRNLFLSNGILKWSSDQIVCPEHMKHILFEAYHDAPFAGHRSYENTMEALRSRFFWVHMPSEVKAYCQSCSECQKFNYSNIILRAPMEPIYVYRPFQIIGMDFMGPFLETENGNVYIVLAIDHFTKYVIGAATINIDSETTAKFLFNEIICKFGIMENVLTDRGANFEAHLFQQLCRLLKTNKLRTTAFHPSGNGTTERVNKTVKPNIAKYVDTTHKNWDDFVQLAISSYNNVTHSSTGISPFEAMFGRRPVLVADVINNAKLPSTTLIRNVSDFVLNLKIKAFEMSKIMQNRLNEAHLKQKEYYDKFVKENVEFQVGDLIKLKNFKVAEGHSKAFTEKFLGPFKIVGKLNDLVFIIMNGFGKEETIHYNRMSKWYERDQVIPKIQVGSKQTNNSIINNEQKVEHVSVEFQPLIENQRMNRYLSLINRRKKKQNLPRLNLNNNNMNNELLLNISVGEEEIVEAEETVQIQNNNNNILPNLDQDLIDVFVNNNQINANHFENMVLNNLLDPVVRPPHRYNTRLQAAAAPIDQDDVSEINISNNNNMTDEEIINVLFDDLPRNEKGKVVVQCVNCGKWCERQYGLGVHMRSCGPNRLNVQINEPIRIDNQEISDDSSVSHVSGSEDDNPDQNQSNIITDQEIISEIEEPEISRSQNNCLTQ